MLMIFLNIACMHCLAGLGMLSLCVYYDLYAWTNNLLRMQEMFTIHRRLYLLDSHKLFFGKVYL